MDDSKLILVGKHFLSNSHNFNRDAKFTIIEKIEKKKKNVNIKLITEKQKDKWKTVSEHVPFGLNMKLNYPALK